MDLSQLDPAKPGGGDSVDQGALRIRETRDASVTSMALQHALAGQHAFKPQAQTSVSSGNIAVDSGALSFSDGAGWYLAGGLGSEDVSSHLTGGQITYGTRSVVGRMPASPYVKYIPYWYVTGQNWWRWGSPQVRFTWSTATTAPPANQQIRINASSVNPGNASLLWVHNNDLDNLQGGSTWAINARPGYDVLLTPTGGDPKTSWTRYAITQQATAFSTYTQIPVNFVGGLGFSAGPYYFTLVPNYLYPWDLMTFTFRCTLFPGNPNQLTIGNPITINTSGFSMDVVGNNLDQTWVIVPGLIVPANIPGYGNVYTGSVQIGLDGQGNMQEGMFNVDVCFGVIAGE